MEYLVAAYVVIWIAIFAFVLSIGARQRRLSQELEDLRHELERIKKEE